MVELLVVATIISMLAAVGSVSYNALGKQSRDSKRKADLEQIRSALEMYRSDNSYYPDTLPALTSYIPRTPSDPRTTNSYAYCPTGSPGSMTSYSLCSTLEVAGASKTCCANCGGTCYYKLGPLGEE